MATTTTPSIPPSAATTTAPSSEFNLRRAALVSQIGDSLEQVLSQINALNRGLEGIIEIGNEFASMEALWSQFEGVMGPGHPNGNGGGQKEGDGKGQRGEDGGGSGEEGEDGETELVEGKADERGH